MYLLSANGTLRTILILLILWQLLRLWMRMQRAEDKRRKPTGTYTDGTRPKGDVRIEQVKEIKHGAPPTNAEDADFEEIN